MSRVSYTAKSLKHFRASGWQCAVVEKFIPHINIRKDVWNFGDLLVCNPEKKLIGLVQVTTEKGGQMSKHKKKILSIKERRIWKQSGGLIFLHAWGLKGKRGEPKTYQLREKKL